MNCDAQLLDKGFTYECELSEHDDSVPHQSGVRFEGRGRLPMFGLLRWSLLPDAVDGLRDDDRTVRTVRRLRRQLRDMTEARDVLAALWNDATRGNEP